MDEVTRTHCPYCALQCGMRLSGPFEKSAVAGDETFPVNQGALCIKGWTAAATLAHPERLLHPLARNARGAFMAQYVRFGYLKEMPDAKAIADKLVLSDLYREVAADMHIAIPSDDMRPFTLKLDGLAFDPGNPTDLLGQGIRDAAPHRRGAVMA